MSEKAVSTPYNAITHKIIGCALVVHRKLGPGLREDSYERTLALKLEEAGMDFEAQRHYAVEDQQQRFIGYYIPDFIVEEKVIVEIKALKGVDNSHLAQVIGYLVASQCPIGLQINFGERSLKYRRVFPPHKVTQHIINRQWLFVPDWLKDHQDRIPADQSVKLSLSELILYNFSKHISEQGISPRMFQICDNHFLLPKNVFTNPCNP
jgi:GxxExxY protein